MGLVGEIWALAYLGIPSKALNAYYKVGDLSFKFKFHHNRGREYSRVQHIKDESNHCLLPSLLTFCG